MRPEIDLSIVVAASWSAEAAARTVASIGVSDGVEVIVASDPDRVAPVPLPGGARWVVGGRGDGVPRLRRLGADRARGPVVAFVEDACVVGPGWVDAILKAFADEDCLAASGPVLQGDGASATDWAVYFAEYAPFSGSARRSDRPPTLPSHTGGEGEGSGAVLSGPLPPCGGGLGWGVASPSTSRLAGINFACRREALGPSPTIREAELSSRLAGSIRWIDGASVSHVRHYHPAEALADRWRFGREFGRDRWSDRPGSLRRLGVAAAPAILGVQLARLARGLWRDRSLRKPALASSPETLALLMAWSSGEALGWAEACHIGSRRRERAAPRPASGIAPASIEPAGCKSSPIVA